MRYLGNKARLLEFISKVIKKYKISGDTFADLFSGTGVVGDYFKSEFRIISNDYMYFSYVISKAKLMNNVEPTFAKFVCRYNSTPFEWFNNKKYILQDNFFIYKHFTLQSNRMYLTEANALRIDGIRLDIEDLYEDDTINEKEYFYLLASLIESIPRFSNTSGTYQAFLKFWDSRALKEFRIEPLEMFKSERIQLDNEVYNCDTNKLVREITGSIAYIDPPYTTTQYTNSYHLLETVAKYDYPELFGKTGRRVKRELSNYSNKQQAIVEFEDLFRQIRFEHILVSYSNQSIITIDELVELAKKFAVNNEVFVEMSNYREYSTNNLSYKGEGEKLKEVVIYFKKYLKVEKSPLNYSGSKDVVLPEIISELPKHVGTFVDAMGGAFNVGANIFALDKVIYNEYNPYIFGIVNMLLTKDKEAIICEVDETIEKFDLRKKGKKQYLNLREHYNNVNNSHIYLFTLQIYAFQNMIRFNSSKQMNTPVGNNDFNEGTRERIRNFKVKTSDFHLINGKYKELQIEKFPKDTLFYFDPPYYVTNAEYNDGKRGLNGWGSEEEVELLNYLLNIHSMGYKFMLSNVLYHRGKRHNLLIEWVQTHDFIVKEIGNTGIKYPRNEVLIKNF